MLASLLLQLRPRADGVLRVTPARALHAALLKLIELADPAVSARLHAPAQVRPFTLSGLEGPLARGPGGLAVRGGATYQARLTLLQAEGFEAFRLALGYQASQGCPLVLDWTEFDLVGLIDECAPLGTPPGSGLCLVRYAELVRRAAPVDRIELRFVSPTSFQQGGRPCLEPRPELVFRSYLERWRHFADAPLPIDLEDSDLTAAAVLEAQQIDSARLDFGAFRRPGFVGRCIYTLQGPPAQRQALAALADYAFFCGTGAKTALGMGQTRRVVPPALAPPGRSGQVSAQRV